jgi:hypothetical protein
MYLHDARLELVVRLKARKDLLSLAYAHLSDRADIKTSPP